MFSKKRFLTGVKTRDGYNSIIRQHETKVVNATKYKF